ncbi:MAG: dimethylsulfonioproprionate lyase family protein [Alphaproteobacteria bacterium]
MATKRQNRVFTLIEAIRRSLETRAKAYPQLRLELNDCLARIDGLELNPSKLELEDAQIPDHKVGLQHAILSINDSELSPLKRDILTAKDDLCWRVDEGVYYKSTDNLGNYVGNNLHCQLVGPNGVAYKTNDVMFGLFYLAPKVLYRDHNHMAPELYLTLSDRSGWRFGTQEPWADYPANSLIWNAPMEVHATRVYDEPFFAVFVWTKDIPEPPMILEPDVKLLKDWAMIEEGLKTKK